MPRPIITGEIQNAQVYLQLILKTLTWQLQILLRTEYGQFMEDSTCAIFPLRAAANIMEVLRGTPAHLTTLNAVLYVFSHPAKASERSSQPHAISVHRLG